MTDIVEYKENLTLDECINNVIHGDCLQVMKTLPDKSIDLIITSPPYNMRNHVGGNIRCPNKGLKLSYGYDNYDDNMPNDKYEKWQRACLDEMCRLIKDDGAIFYNNKNRMVKCLMLNRYEIMRGLPLRQIITWQKAGGISHNPQYFLPTTEQIYMICNRKFKLIKGANKLTDVWRVNQERKNPHPAPFPEELIERIVQSTDKKLILDPFGGSCTTAIVAKNNNRDFISIDMSLNYCKMQVKRINGDESWRNKDAIIA